MQVLTSRQVESGTLVLTEVIFDPKAAVADVVQVCRLGCGITTAADNGIGWSCEPLPELVKGGALSLLWRAAWRRACF
jgi:hypothetical protein